MGNRISKVVTRTGDDGSTGLADGTRCLKDDPLIHAIGEVDELNAQIGLLRAEELPTQIDAVLEIVQHHLFDLGGALSLQSTVLVDSLQPDWLEAQIEEGVAGLAPLQEFILPAGSRAVAQCHVTRAVCRRAERALVAADADAQLRVYLNRLSDLLFVLARQLAGGAERQWSPGKGLS